MSYLYTAFVVMMSIVGKHVCESQWEHFKAREALKPQQMVLKKGVYVPWGRVQKIQRIGHIWLCIWVAYMIALIGLCIYYGT